MTEYVYEHDKGFGEHHNEAPLTAEMQELDMAPGTEVTLEGTNEDGTKIVSWHDKNRPELPRMTSIDPGFFDEHFRSLS